MEDTGPKTVSITFDGAPCNISMATHLGANSSYGANFRLYFLYNNEKNYIFWYACHLLKLIGNTVGDKGTLMHCNEEIKWSLIEQLHSTRNGGFTCSNDAHEKACEVPGKSHECKASSSGFKH